MYKWAAERVSERGMAHEAIQRSAKMEGKQDHKVGR